MSKQISRIDHWAPVTHTQADYDPNYKSVQENTSKGKLSMQQTLNREYLPQGRPMAEPNLVVLPCDYTHSINPDLVTSGFTS